MSNKKEFLNRLEIEESFRGMSDRQLIEFTARQVYEVCRVASNHTDRIQALEKQNTKFFGIIGGVGTIIGAVVVSIINYLLRRG